MTMDGVRLAMLDIDGVLVDSWEPIAGAADAVAALRDGGLTVRFLTNTTSRTRAAIAEALRAAGIAVEDDEISTATSATATYLARHHPDARVLLSTTVPPTTSARSPSSARTTTPTSSCSAGPGRRSDGSG